MRKKIKMKKRMYYCPRCQAVFIKSRYERKTCEYCGKDCVVIKVWYSIWYVLGIIVLCICAGVLFIYQNLDMPSRILILIVGFIIAVCFTAIGLERMKKRALKIGKGKS